MHTTVLTIAAAGVLIGAVAAADGQAGQPGRPTQARVWIENRGDAEAVPVALARTGRVEVAGPVTLDPAAVLGTRAARQPWEYRTTIVPAGTDAAVALKAAGADGWEAVGVVSSAPDTVVLLKRPR